MSIVFVRCLSHAFQLIWFFKSNSKFLIRIIYLFFNGSFVAGLLVLFVYYYYHYYYYYYYYYRLENPKEVQNDNGLFSEESKGWPRA